MQYGQAAARRDRYQQERTRRPRYGWVTGYEFELPDGSMRKGVMQTGRTWMQDQMVCILHDRKRPRRNGVYPVMMSEIVE